MKFFQAQTEGDKNPMVINPFPLYVIIRSIGRCACAREKLCPEIHHPYRQCLQKTFLRAKQRQCVEVVLL